MTGNPYSTIGCPPSLRYALITYALTIGFCLAIALILWVVQIVSFGDSVTISLAIGLSISSISLLAQYRLERWLPPAIAPIPLQLSGLLLGLLIGAWLTKGDPLYFFQQEHPTLYLGLFFGVLAYAIFSTLARLAESKAQLALAQQQQAEQDRQLAHTQLKLLQAQIEPHFLFNTLSNATSLIHSDPTAAEATLENLSTLLRKSLTRTRASITTLGEELEMLQAYLGIAQIRMGDRLQYEFDVPATLSDQSLPPLLLQPLVENAIVHGLEPKAAGGRVQIKATQTDTQLVLQVADDGLGISTQAGNSNSSAHNGTALTNIRARLHALYGEAGTLLLRDNHPSGIIAVLSIPKAKR